MLRTTKWGRAAVAGLSMLIVAMAAGAADAADKVSLRLGWTYGGMFAPIYLGIDKGFFSDAGIDLDVREGKGSVPSATSVANGQDDFGYFDMAAAARLIDKGLPLKGIAQIRQKTGMCVISLEKSGLTQPKQLEGHSVSHTPGDSLSQVFPAFIKATGIDGSKIKQEGLDYSVYLKALENGQVDAIMAYVDEEGFTLENKGLAINKILFADNGVTLVDYGFATSPAMIAKNPDLVKRFVAAVVKSFDYARDHVDEAVAAGQKRFPEFDQKLATKQVAYQPELFGDAVKNGKPIGWIDEATWQGALATLHDYMGLKNTDPSLYYTNEFIPGGAS